MLRSRKRSRGGGNSGAVVPPFSPLDISGLALWLDASDTSPSNIQQTSGSVNQWNDKSGNGNHATQGTGVNQPITGTRTINSLNVLDFDGSNDFLDIKSGIYNISNGDNTLLCVCFSDNTAVNQAIFRETNYRFSYLASGTQLLFQNGAGSLTTVGSAGSIASPRILTARRSGTDLNINLDSGISSTGTGATSASVTQLRLGTAGFDFWNGVFAEVIFYNSSLSATDLNKVGNYLAAKWGITWTNI